MNLCYIPQAGLDIITAIEGEGHQSEKGSKSADSLRRLDDQVGNTREEQWNASR